MKSLKSKQILDEILEVQQSVLDNLNHISIVAISDNQMIEVVADGNRKISAIHINEELLSKHTLPEVAALLTETVNKALDMSLEAQDRETTRIMDAFTPTIFDDFQ
ncbi:MAG: YbaB/EbfC family nucleoid-associated protein [Bacteroidetes bacterium]|jgi:DNA-binding protein YbaB|nr:YbaB/EbfC family nucleoid-associated protein [Bacteroidota bacterium]